MTSKNSSFKELSAFCLEGLRRRLWSCALSALAFFFAYPVAAAVIISNTRKQMQYRNLPAVLMEQYIKRGIFSTYRNAVSPGSFMPVFILAILAIVLAVSGFSWLFSSKETDYYHSLPIRREKLFAVVTADSIFIAAAPFALMSAVSGFIIMAATGRKRALWVSFTGFVYNMAMFLLCYAASVTALMLTGHKLVSILGACAFYGTGPLIAGGVHMLFTNYFKSYFDETGIFPAVMHHSSPVLWALNIDSAPAKVSAAVWALVWAAVLTALSILLYKKRPSEAAGRAIAFKWAEPVIKVVLSCAIGIFAGTFIHSLMLTTRAADGWTVFGAACGVILTACILEIIYHADFKKLFSGKKALLLSAVIVCAVFCIFRFDIFGYDRWLPAEGKVASAGLYCDSLEMDSWNYQRELTLEQNDMDGRYYVMTTMTGNDGRGMIQRLADDTALPDTGKVRTIAEQGIRDLGSDRQNEIYTGPTAESTDTGKDIFGTVVVSWRLTNGRTKYREYYMNLTAVRDELDSIHDCDAWKTQMYPALSMGAEELSGINYNTAGRFYHLPAAGREVLEAWQEDMRGLTADTRRNEMPLLCLQFKTEEFQAMADTIREQDPYMLDMFNNCGYYPVYPSFTKTLALLEKCGLHTDDLLHADKALSAEIWDYRSFFGGEPDYTGQKSLGSVLIEDKEELEQILACAVPADLVCGNSYGRCYTGLEVSVRYPFGMFQDMQETESPDGAKPAAVHEVYSDMRIMDRGYQDACTVRFPADDAPQFIRDRFGITDEDIRLESGSGGY
ncbi:MAG: hypothetical protein J6P87_00605 [Lachnospiraceae bacterium]|nr:hypothetical protein [Lachnospiraceae bacterium]